MDRLTVEENKFNMYLQYRQGGLLEELSEIQTHLEQDETELIETYKNQL